jgi:hypothetical protein
MEMMQRLQWTLPRLGTALGPAGALAALLLVSSLLFYLLQVVPQARSSAALEADNIKLQQLRAEGGLRVADSPSTQLARFDALLPSVRDLPAVLSRVHADAVQHGVDLSEGQFKLSIEPGHRIARYQITFPIKAGYAATREFVRAVMLDTPAMAVEELSFERSDPKSSISNTRIQFVLFALASEQGTP